MTDLEKVCESLRMHYLPRVREAIEEHEEFCRTHPHVAAFLSSLPNGGWRKGVLAGENMVDEESDGS